LFFFPRVGAFFAFTLGPSATLVFLLASGDPGEFFFSPCPSRFSFLLRDAVSSSVIFGPFFRFHFIASMLVPDPQFAKPIWLGAAA